MNIALFAAPGVWASLQGLLRWVAPGTLPAARRQTAPKGRPRAFAVDSIASQNQATGHGNQNPIRLAQCRPLRVVRVVEAGQTPMQVGRMVISGRMADVCAELDRLAACEAARH
jgi:hypothetical protein